MNFQLFDPISTQAKLAQTNAVNQAIQQREYEFERERKAREDQLRIYNALMQQQAAQQQLVQPQASSVSNMVQQLAPQMQLGPQQFAQQPSAPQGIQPQLGGMSNMVQQLAPQMQQGPQQPRLQAPQMQLGPQQFAQQPSAPQGIQPQTLEGAQRLFALEEQRFNANTNLFNMLLQAGKPKEAQKVMQNVASTSQTPMVRDMAGQLANADLSTGTRFMTGAQLKQSVKTDTDAQRYGYDNAAEVQLLDNKDLIKFSAGEKGAWKQEAFDRDKTILRNPLVKTMPIDDKGTMGTFQYNPQTNDWEQIAEGKKPSSVSGRYSASDEDARRWANMVARGATTLDAVPKYGGLAAKVGSMLESMQQGSDNKMNYSAQKSTTKALTSAEAFQTKMLTASNNYIKTIDLNLKRLDDIVAKISQKYDLDGSVVWNMGLRTFLNKYKGDGTLAAYDYMIATLSAETGKLVNGGAGSVAQLNEGARVEMGKIHAADKPLSQMKILMETTRGEGEDRINAMKEELKEIRSRFNTDIPKQQPKAKQIKSQAPSFEEYVATMRKKFPQYVGKTTAEWKKAYERQFGGM